MIRVNDEDQPYREGLRVQDLLVELDPTQPIAVVKRNGAHVPRAAWASTVIADGDDLRVVYIIAGG